MLWLLLLKTAEVEKIKQKQKQKKKDERKIDAFRRKLLIPDPGSEIAECPEYCRIFCEPKNIQRIFC